MKIKVEEGFNAVMNIVTKKATARFTREVMKKGVDNENGSITFGELLNILNNSYRDALSEAALALEKEIEQKKE